MSIYADVELDSVCDDCRKVRAVLRCISCGDTPRPFYICGGACRYHHRHRLHADSFPTDANQKMGHILTALLRNALKKARGE